MQGSYAAQLPLGLNTYNVCSPSTSLYPLPYGGAGAHRHCAWPAEARSAARQFWPMLLRRRRLRGCRAATGSAVQHRQVRHQRGHLGRHASGAQGQADHLRRFSSVSEEVSQSAARMQASVGAKAPVCSGLQR